MPKTTHQPSPPPSAKLHVPTTTPSPPKLQTAARSEERLAKADVFNEHAERAQKLKEMQLEAYKRHRHEAEMARSVQSYRIPSPGKSVSIPGHQRWEATQAKLNERRLEREKEQMRMAVSFRARDFKLSPLKTVKPVERRITVADPFVLRSMARHATYQAKLNQKIQEEKERDEATDGKRHEFHPRPVPKTTYKYVPISSKQENSESMRRVEKLHKQRVEERIRCEKERESRFHPRPVPQTTYEAKAITASDRVEESLRRVTELQHLRQEEQKKKEEEKDLEQAEFEYKPRPVPTTTYSPRSISALEKKALQDAALAREKKLEELKKQEEESKSPDRFHSRPVPPSTYKPPSYVLSPRYEDSLRHSKNTRQHKMDELKKKEEEKSREDAEFHYKPRPLPITTYTPSISPKGSPSDRRRQRTTSTHSEFLFKARPVPKTTYAPSSVNAAASMKDPPIKSSSTKKKSSSAEHFEFHARPLPKTTYRPSVLSPPRSATKEELPSSRADGPPFRHHRCEPSQTSPLFSARPVPVTTYQPQEFSSKHLPYPVKSRAGTSIARSPRKQTSPPRSPKQAGAVVVKANNDPKTKNYSFRARSVPKSTYQSPKKQSIFRPITRPKQYQQSASNEADESPSFRARPVPKSTYKHKPATRMASANSKTGIFSSPAGTSDSSKQHGHSFTTSVSAQERQASSKAVYKAQENRPLGEDSELAAILDDDEAAEITFGPVGADGDEDTGKDDPELAAILKNVDPWTATATNESVDELDVLLDD